MVLSSLCINEWNSSFEFCTEQHRTKFEYLSSPSSSITGEIDRLNFALSSTEQNSNARVHQAQALRVKQFVWTLHWAAQNKIRIPEFTKLRYYGWNSSFEFCTEQHRTKFEYLSSPSSGITGETVRLNFALSCTEQNSNTWVHQAQALRVK